MKILMSSPSPGVESIVDVVGCGVTLIVIGLLWEVSHGPTYPKIAVSSSDMEKDAAVPSLPPSHRVS